MRPVPMGTKNMQMKVGHLVFLKTSETKEPSILKISALKLPLDFLAFVKGKKIKLPSLLVHRSSYVHFFSHAGSKKKSVNLLNWKSKEQEKMKELLLLSIVSNNSCFKTG